MELLRTLRTALPPPHRAGWPFIGLGVLAWLAGLAWAGWLAAVGGLFTLACFGFFRDPERVTPERADLAVAPADGIVVSTAPAPPPEELGLGPEPRPRVSIFLSVLNVHVNRMPVSGRVLRTAYRIGAFLSASLDKASERNERNGLVLRLEDGREMAVVQIAGLIARRIVCHVRAGDAVRRGQRFGIIRFGSRTDLYLPPGVQPLVAVGQTMVGGETIVADLSDSTA